MNMQGSIPQTPERLAKVILNYASAQGQILKKHMIDFSKNLLLGVLRYIIAI